MLLAFLLITLGSIAVASAGDFFGASGPSGATRPSGISSQPGTIRQVTHQEPEPAPFATSSSDKPLALPVRPGDSLGEKSSSGPRTMGAIVSVAASLAVVLGLFFVFAWLMRRSQPSSARRLPYEVVELLGRAPLAGRQQMHLLRFGNKLLLVCVSPTGVDTLAEITDPLEIDRVSGLCAQTESSSATKAFKQIFGQLAGDKSLVAPTGGNRKSSLSADGHTAATTGEAVDVL